MFPNAIRFLTRTALVFAAAAAVSAGCTRQAEGERCDFEWAGDQDCDSGLVCTKCGALADDLADRCCPADGSANVPGCRRASTDNGTFCSSHKAPDSNSSGGSSGAGGSGGSDSSGGGDTGGAGDMPTAGTEG